MKILQNPTFVIVIILLSFFISLNCQKEEITENYKQPTFNLSETGDTLFSNEINNSNLRNGAGLVFYRMSLTTDNYLLPGPRTYNIYNKSKIKEIQFLTSGLGLANIGGVLCKSYKINIIFTDNSNESFIAYSKNGPDSFNYVPVGENLLSNSHTANKIRIVATTNNSQSQYHFWRDIITPWRIWEIYKDNTLIERRYLEATDKSSNIFIPKHQH